MPSHPERVRTEPLSDHYQFGDGRTPIIGHAHAFTMLKGDDCVCRCGKRWDGPDWRAPHANAAEQLKRNPVGSINRSTKSVDADVYWPNRATMK